MINIKKKTIINIIIIMTILFAWRYSRPVEINRTLDREHRQIFKNLDTLYNNCEKHWKTEESLYKKGLQKMPANHADVTQGWESHSQEHQNLLEKIKEMKNTISQHISEKDTRDFHWAA